MPSVTYNGQSFAVDGRRIWILAASIQYARVPAALWAARIAAAKQAGFNTIDVACPWTIHEPRKGRFVFQGDADIRKFIETCAAAGMRVILRTGPYVGSGFDGGGLPGWLIETPGISLRENDEIFLEHVSRYFRKLLGEIVDQQATAGGPILLVQSEHAWTCSNEVQAEKYLHEITRFIRESGVTVPITNANDLWQESPGTIDTWRGYDDLLVHLRQLRTVQSSAPRLVSAFDPAGVDTWGSAETGKGARGKLVRESPAAEKTPRAVLLHLAEILAAGAQPVVSPFHGGTNFGFLGGRLAGGPDRFVTTSAATGAPLGEAGSRTDKYRLIKRLMTFANHYGNVFAELDSEYQPTVLDPAGGGHGIVPLRGAQGRLVFVFAGKSATDATLVLDDGIRLPVHLGDQPVGWFAMDVDLHGSGRLNYANIMPWGIVDRSIVIFQGPAKAAAYLSINNTPLEATVPADGAKPFVVEHKGLTIVICNQDQIDNTYHDAVSVYVGVSGLSTEGKPLSANGSAKAWVIHKKAEIEGLTVAGEHGESKKTAKRESKPIVLSDWQCAAATAYLTGESPRFASLEGPEALSACGAPNGYGWYRVTFNASGKKTCFIPQSADRLHVFMHDQPRILLGVGPGAESQPFEMKLNKGEQTIVVLVDNLGRFANGNDLRLNKGIWGHVHDVRPIRSAKPKLVSGKPVDPFSLRGFIAGRTEGQVSDSQQVSWTFDHPRKTPIVVDVMCGWPSGTLVLNDVPLSYYAGATGACMERVMIDPRTVSAFKRGKNVLRFAPDVRQENAAAVMAKAATLYECVENLTESATWAFAKWEPPSNSAFGAASKASGKAPKSQPCWWRATFDLPADMGHEDDTPLWLDTHGLSKGQAYVNGQNLGRFFTATAGGKAVGPQTALYVPSPWLKPGHANEMMIFDEHGFEPSKVRFMRSIEGQS